MNIKNAKEKEYVAIAIRGMIAVENPEKIADIFIDGINSGMSYKSACEAAGVTEETMTAIMESAKVSSSPLASRYIYNKIMSFFGFVNRPKDKNGGYVYFIRDMALGDIKIGIADDYRKRIQSLQTSCPQELKCVAIIQSPDFKDIEKTLHEKYNYRHHRGEWFTITEAEIDKEIEYYGGRYLA